MRASPFDCAYQHALHDRRAGRPFTPQWPFARKRERESVSPSGRRQRCLAGPCCLPGAQVQFTLPPRLRPPLYPGALANTRASHASVRKVAFSPLCSLRPRPASPRHGALPDRSAGGEPHPVCDDTLPRTCDILGLTGRIVWPILLPSSPLLHCFAFTFCCWAKREHDSSKNRPPKPVLSAYSIVQRAAPVTTKEEKWWKKRDDFPTGSSWSRSFGRG